MKCSKCGAEYETDAVDWILVFSLVIFCICIGGLLMLWLGLHAHFFFDTYGWRFGLFYVDLLPEVLRAAGLGAMVIFILAALIKRYE